jgi:group I intron endonuclease
MKHTSTKVLPTRNKLNYDVPVSLLKKEGFYLYQITNNFDAKVYVGYTTDINDRLNAHARCMRKGSYDNGSRSYLYASAKAHGRENFTYKLLAVLHDFDTMEAAEVALIAKYKEDGFTVYNMTPGGKGLGSGENHPSYGKPLTAEHKAKQSEAKKGEKNHMYGKTGENHPSYGTPRSAEHRAKISVTHKGKTQSAETRAKISVARKGKYTGENSPTYKYPPELIASFPTKKAAIEATGINASHYYKIKRANPDLTWPTTQRKPKS